LSKVEMTWYANSHVELISFVTLIIPAPLLTINYKLPTTDYQLQTNYIASSYP
ncbi:hypothetical protein SAMN05660862_3253, partial [Sphingobacterium psychroaquaticum]